jgi:hypothetical protein
LPHLDPPRSPTGSLAFSLSLSLSPSLPDPRPFTISPLKVLSCPTGSSIPNQFFRRRLLITLMTDEVHTSEMSVYYNVTTWRYIPEGCTLHTHCHENLKSQVILNLKKCPFFKK